MWTACAITIAAALAIATALLFRLCPRGERTRAALCFALILPMSWAMFHLVRQPADAWLTPRFGKSEPFWWLRMAYAPLTEEPAKLWPLLLPMVRRWITRENLARYALALGLGFAIGEMFTVAGLVVKAQPKVAAMPWYLLSGFIVERLMTCAIHPAMTALALYGWRRGAGFALGLLAAMAAHFAGNVPIGMAQRGWLGHNLVATQTLLSLWVLACFVAALAWLSWLIFGKKSLGLLVHGHADCPGCGREYERPFLLAANFGARRYERCPHCRKWHWTFRKPPAIRASA
jgi:hypothetical protein